MRFCLLLPLCPCQGSSSCARECRQAVKVCFSRQSSYSASCIYCSGNCSGNSRCEQVPEARSVCADAPGERARCAAVCRAHCAAARVAAHAGCAAGNAVPGGTLRSTLATIACSGYKVEMRSRHELAARTCCFGGLPFLGVTDVAAVRWVSSCLVCNRSGVVSSSLRW